jgi:hypothetical protein
MKYVHFLIIICLGPQLSAQDCIGGQIHTNEAYLYGRFEVSMRSVGVSGVVSSFFLYNLDVGCNWPEENNEIDIEMTGDDHDVLFTTHYPGPWYYTDTYSPPQSPHEALHDYAIEWEPGVVRWFMDGQLVNVQDQSFVQGLIHPMRIIMNLWAAEVEDWVGPWDPASMPLQSDYDYVRYYAYTPGSGDAGTGNNFSLTWEDHFDELNTDLWTVEDYGGFGGNYCTFKTSGVDFANGLLHLKMEAPDPNPPTVPVSFSVNTNGEGLLPSDVIFLNGTFNEWCGTCRPMTKDGDVWSVTIDLPPGEHEFLFTKNFWEENGGAPLGSSCDFRPCDEWVNYGFTISEGDGPITLPTYCWGTCEDCATTSVETLLPDTRRIIGIYNLLGQRVSAQPGQILLYQYDDGTVEKRFWNEL